MKRRLKPKFKKFLILFGILLSILIFCFLLHRILFAPVSKTSEKVEINVEKGDNFFSVANTLKENNLIKSKLIYKFYVKIKKVSNLKEGKYILDKNMKITEIIDVLSGKNGKNPNIVRITFKEGINMRKISSLIEEKTIHKKEEVYNLLNDEKYLNELISRYWFITDEIMNKDIYYSLEGYLYPDTYEFNSKDVEIKEIFTKMLNNMEKNLEPLKKEMTKNDYTFHQLLTLASIVELEASNSNDRNNVAGVFYNRLNANWNLGSDVTTYYAAKVDMSERNLYKSELTSDNSYNTRSSSMMGKLPIGPICNPSISSIKAAVNPTKHDYYYFVADKNKKIYLSRNTTEHAKIIAKLKKENLWYEY